MIAGLNKASPDAGGRVERRARQDVKECRRRHGFPRNSAFEAGSMEMRLVTSIRKMPIRMPRWPAVCSLSLALLQPTSPDPRLGDRAQPFPRRGLVDCRESQPRSPSFERLGSSFVIRNHLVADRCRASPTAGGRGSWFDRPGKLEGAALVGIQRTTPHRRSVSFRFRRLL